MKRIRILILKKFKSKRSEISQLTKLFPKEELFGLTSQLKRTSSSIPINIAEGCGWGSDADFGSLCK